VFEAFVPARRRSRCIWFGTVWMASRARASTVRPEKVAATSTPMATGAEQQSKDLAKIVARGEAQGDKQESTVGGSSGRGKKRKAKPTQGNEPDKQNTPAASAAEMLESMPTARVATAHTGKFCSFLCGAEFGCSCDPAQSSRASIRWGYENAPPNSPSDPRGTVCYWCRRTWIEHVAAGEHEEEDQQEFQASAAKDHAKLQKFLNRRVRVVARAKKKSENPKCAGLERIPRQSKQRRKLRIQTSEPRKQ